MNEMKKFKNEVLSTSGLNIIIDFKTLLLTQTHDDFIAEL